MTWIVNENSLAARSPIRASALDAVAGVSQRHRDARARACLPRAGAAPSMTASTTRLVGLRVMRQGSRRTPGAVDRLDRGRAASNIQRIALDFSSALRFREHVVDSARRPVMSMACLQASIAAVSSPPRGAPGLSSSGTCGPRPRPIAAHVRWATSRRPSGGGTIVRHCRPASNGPALSDIRAILLRLWHAAQALSRGATMASSDASMPLADALRTAVYRAMALSTWRIESPQCLAVTACTHQADREDVASGSTGRRSARRHVVERPDDGLRRPNPRGER